MAGGDSAGKTEKPTPRKLRQARKEGQFARTQDAPVWVGIVAGFALLPVSARIAQAQFRELFDRLPVVAGDPTPARAMQLTADVLPAVLKASAPVCLAAMVAAVLALAVQGVHPTSKAMRPKFSRLNPAQGVKRMFGPKAAWEGLKALLKVAVIAAVVATVGRDLIPQLAGSGALPLSATVERTRSGLSTTVWAASAAGLALAGADYLYQRRTVLKQLMMSPREIKEEVKQTEGDPQVKSQIRARQIAVSRNRMLSRVASADVVLVNPTHVAVALRYQPGKGAPRLVAKGAGAVAAKIRDRAREHRVPVVEDKPLARTLFRVCELEEEIPAELYMAVARILAFVMSAGKPGRYDGARRPPTTEPVPPMPTRAELKARRAKEVRVAREQIALRSGRPGGRHS